MPSRLADNVRIAAGYTDSGTNHGDRERGAYRKGRVRIQGLVIAIENPRLTIRQGTSPDGTYWSSILKWDYGEIQRTEGVDGDPVDVFIGPRPESEIVFVVDQIDQETGEFDEHKVMLGWDNRREALEAYLENYQEGWRPGHVTPFTMQQFQEWLASPSSQRPAAQHDGRCCDTYHTSYP